MDISRVERGERIAIYGGIALAVGLFLTWYDVKAGSELAHGDQSAWDAHPTMRWFLLAAAIAPLILAWIIANDHALSWPRGQMTMVVAIAAFGLIAYNGLIDKPGESNSFSSLQYGWFISLAGTLLMLWGSVRRQNETEIRRKPPGTI
jgi:archaellum biogenesis protein FlaJ (TadC family)